LPRCFSGGDRTAALRVLGLRLAQLECDKTSQRTKRQLCVASLSCVPSLAHARGPPGAWPSSCTLCAYAGNFPAKTLQRRQNDSSSRTWLRLAQPMFDEASPRTKRRLCVVSLSCVPGLAHARGSPGAWPSSCALCVRRVADLPKTQQPRRSGSSSHTWLCLAQLACDEASRLMQRRLSVL